MSFEALLSIEHVYSDAEISSKSKSCVLSVQFNWRYMAIRKHCFVPNDALDEK